MKFSQQKILRLGAVLVGIVVVYGLFTSYASGKGAVLDGMSTMSPQELGGEGSAGPMSETGPYVPASETGSLGGNAVQVSGMQGATPTSQQTYTQRTLDAGELLPKGEIGASWAAVNPTGVNDLQGQNFLQSSYHTNVSIVGVGQTNRNPTYDIRSEVPNSQAKVGPFLNSTIDPDPFRASRALDGLCA
jgi:hypothetical protein